MKVFTFMKGGAILLASALSLNVYAGVNFQLEIKNASVDEQITINKVWYKHKNSWWERVHNISPSGAITFDAQECTELTENSWTNKRYDCDFPSEHSGKAMHYSVFNSIAAGGDTHYWKASVFVKGHGAFTVQGKAKCGTSYNRCTSTLYFSGDSLVIGDTEYPLYMRESFDSYLSDELFRDYEVVGASYLTSGSDVGLDWGQAMNGNNAFSFDGIDDYISIPDSDNLDFGPNDDFTVSLWVNPDNYQPSYSKPDNAILEKWSGSGGYPYVIRWLNESGKIRVARYDGSKSAKIDSRWSILRGGINGGWRKIEFTKFGKQLKLYIDGVLQGTTKDTTTGNTKNSSPLFLGKRGGSKLPIHFSGQIDEVRIYPYAKTEMKNLQAIISRDYNKDTCMSSPLAAVGSIIQMQYSDCDNSSNSRSTFLYDALSGYIHLAANTNLCVHTNTETDTDWKDGNYIFLNHCSEGTKANKSWTYNESTGIIHARANPAKCMAKKYYEWKITNIVHLWSGCDNPRANNTWFIRDL